MIVPMRKITVVTLSSEKEEALRGLRETGVVHLDFGDGRSADLDGLLGERLTVERALLAISEATKEGERFDLNPNETVVRVTRIEEEKRNLADELDSLLREKERVEPWGDFDPADLGFLRESGVALNLYVLSREEYEGLSERNDVYLIRREKTILRVAVANGTIEGALPVSPFERSLGSIEKRLEEIRQTLTDLDTELMSFGPLKDDIEAVLRKLDESIKFERAKISMGQDNELSYIRGFVPEPKVESLKNAAKTNSWAILVKEPEEEDTVPVLLQNKKPIRIISPIFDLLGSLPGYHEYDISLWFLLFFSLFFAMIVGDAGYGFIFLAMTLVAVFMRKSKGKPAGLELILLTVLSSVTIIWGALSGTWFGSETISEAAPFRYLVVQSISSFNPKSSDTIKYFCFVIGTVHVTLAHGWNFITEIRQKPRMKAFGQLGWMLIVLGAFYLVLNLVLDPIKYPIPDFALYMVAGGIGLVVLFSNQEGNFLKGLLKGFAGLFQTFLSSISTFADVISYIRLFAVGLATVEIAKSFNAMAADMGNTVVGLIGSILVLAIGHGINLIMAALSVIVHGVRLNMLEFSTHLGMEWSGIPYDPFSHQATTLKRNE